MSSITLNGSEHPLESPVPLSALLATLGLDGKPVVVELDGRAVLRTEHRDTLVHPGSRVEIITLAAGG